MIILGLGSNLSSSYGDRFNNINLAMEYLEGYGIKILKIYKNEDLFVKDMVIINKDIEINNGLVRSVDCVMFVQPSKDDIRLDSETRNIYSITSCCLRTEEEVKLFLSTI